MSLDSAKAFIEKMKSDAAFKERVLAIEGVAERLLLIKSEGFDCTEEQIKQLAEELSEYQLGMVAGGGTEVNDSCGRDCSKQCFCLGKSNDRM